MATVWSDRPAHIAASTRINGGKTVADHSLFGVIIGAWPGSHCRRSRSPTGRRVRRWRSAPAPSRPATPRPPSGAAAADLAAGLGLIVAGSLVSSERSRGAIGPVTTLLGVVWLAPDLVGWEQGPAFVRSLAMLAAPFLLPLLVHLVVAFPAGRLRARGSPSRRSTARRPSSAPAARCCAIPSSTCDCWSNCTDNVFLVHADPDLARSLDDVWLRVSVARRPRPGRRSPSGGSSGRRARGGRRSGRSSCPPRSPRPPRRPTRSR